MIFHNHGSWGLWDRHRQDFKMSDAFQSLFFSKINCRFLWMPLAVWPSKTGLTQKMRKSEWAKSKIMSGVTTVTTSKECQNCSPGLPRQFLFFSFLKQNIWILSWTSSLLFQQATALIAGQFFLDSGTLKYGIHNESYFLTITMHTSNSFTSIFVPMQTNRAAARLNYVCQCMRLMMR